MWVPPLCAVAIGRCWRAGIPDCGSDWLHGLTQQFPGLSRLAKLLERVAAGIQSGVVQVPK